MGHDAIAIGNHSRNTQSIYYLAVDLAKRTGVIIKYGYVNDWVALQGLRSTNCSMTAHTHILQYFYYFTTN